jgi:hypothetical protein
MHLKASGLQAATKLCQEDGCGKQAQRAEDGTDIYCIAHMKQRGLTYKCALSCITCSVVLQFSAAAKLCKRMQDGMASLELGARRVGPYVVSLPS